MLSGDTVKIRRSPEDRRVSKRINQVQTVRIRPAEPQYAEEIRTTLNVSWDSFYFATSLSQYFPGMVVHVTRDFHANDPKNREEQGTVVRVDKLKESRWGIAVYMARDIWRNKAT